MHKPLKNITFKWDIFLVYPCREYIKITEKIYIEVTSFNKEKWHLTKYLKKHY